MNKRIIELKKKELRKIIKTTYSPTPKKIDTWYEKEDDTFRSLTKFRKDDKEIYLALWDKNDLECIEEICLTDTTYKHIYKTITAHRLYSATSEGD